MPMTHRELVQVAAKWLAGTRRCHVVLTERGLSEIPDALGWGNVCVVVECKVSRADFLADKGKPHRHQRATAFGRERWYLTEPGLIGANELPERWGLLEWTGRIVRKRRPAELFEYDIAHVQQELRLALSELRAYHAQGISYKTITGNVALPHLAASQEAPTP